ncbi:MAG TPA: hypothetical protein VKV25_02075, partial [Acidimicrobiales bacterium]|nr:hypothetical protein [Acidimicrobiales bacterium]
VDEVERLVLLTVDHVAGPGDEAGAALCDADLAVLGRPPAGYLQYVELVRAEYAAVPEGGWRRGRAAVLHALLGRPAIYATAEGRRRWEEAARRNLTAELAALKGGAGLT